MRLLLPTKKSVILLSLVVVMLVLFLSIALNLTSQHPPFVAQLGGREIPRPWPNGQRLPSGFAYFDNFPNRFYGFSRDRETVKAEVTQGNGALEIGVDHLGMCLLKSPSGDLIHIYDSKSAPMPLGVKTVVVVIRQQNWLERQWSAIRNWFAK